MWFVILVSMVCVQWSQAALPLPSYIKPCARNDPQLYECSAKHANDAISHLLKGDPKYKMPALDPFKIDELKLVQGEGPRNSIALLLKNMSSYVNKVILLEKSEYDFKKKHIFHQVIIPRVDNVGKYEIQGRLLLLPIFGQGDFNITLDNCRITYDADFIYETIDGKEYFSERNQATTITPTNVNIEFTNLFNGDKLLGKQVN
ncbi:protein takeout-like isoform X2 [Periplaneta americana]|uniref:protein takeout-like isoform X2 n=1 Tax=Periplaneta americana TaxID=6978 RepID=UPI0037E92BA1